MKKTSSVIRAAAEELKKQGNQLETNLNLEQLNLQRKKKMRKDVVKVHNYIKAHREKYAF